MPHSPFAFLFFIVPFIHGIPYGVPDSDDTAIGSQQLSLPQLPSPEALTDPTLFAAGAMDKFNVLNGWIIADAFNIVKSDSTNPIIPATTDTSNPFSPTTDTSQPFLLSAGLSDPTYTFNAPENQDNNEVVPTDISNVEGSTGTSVAQEYPPQEWPPHTVPNPKWRDPPPLAPEDRPNYDTPNCEGQRSRDNSHQRFLSCCNLAKTQCVYYKRTHILCQRVPNRRGPAHPIQCCSTVPVDGKRGFECQNANNPFHVNVPSINTPFGGTPAVKFDFNYPDVSIPGEDTGVFTPGDTRGVTPGEVPVELPVGPGLRLWKAQDRERRGVCERSQVRRGGVQHLENGHGMVRALSLKP